MAGAVVHFEIEGRDAAGLREFYGQVFGWRVDVDLANPAEYGMIRLPAAAGAGLSGAISRVPDVPSRTWSGPDRDQGYSGHVTVFVEVDDVEATLRRSEELGGRRMQGPDPMQPGVVFGKLADPEGHIVGVVGPQPG